MKRVELYIMEWIGIYILFGRKRSLQTHFENIIKKILAAIPLKSNERRGAANSISGVDGPLIVRAGK